MRLSPFIRAELERILSEWDRFARSNSPVEAGLTDLVLRDHAKEMLLAIASDIESPQSAEQQQRKSQGLEASGDSDSAASVHGAQRHRNEFSLAQLGAEFRALRSTVLRLWLPQVGEMCERTVLEVIRFNESIDQALAESLVAYTEATEHARNLLTAVLGHDLRSPLATMSLAGQILARDDLSTAQRVDAAQRVQRSARLMTGMVEDLLGYTRVQFGSNLPISPRWCNVAEILEAAVADAEATHPRTRYELRVTGELAGRYDGSRLHQLFTNLLVNAAQHGAKSIPVAVEASETDERISVRVTNQGLPIPKSALKSIFKPLVQLAPQESSDTRASTSLGLGLFIAREITEGHGGTLEVHSDETSGTTFSVRLPRAVSGSPGQA